MVSQGTCSNASKKSHFNDDDILFNTQWSMYIKGHHFYVHFTVHSAVYSVADVVGWLVCWLVGDIDVLW